MTFTESIRTCFSKYATFEGRASRSEYWWFFLFLLHVSVLGVWLVDVFGRIIGDEHLVDEFLGLTALATLLPWLAVTCRRLHDRGLSGWWQLFPIVLISVPFFFPLFVSGELVADIARDLRGKNVSILFFFAICGSLYGSFILLIVIERLPTKPEENKYGPPPLDVAVKTAE